MPPEGWNATRFTMSNFDHQIDEGMEEALRTDSAFGFHAGWEFCGLVWFQDGRFHEQVFRHHCHVATYSADNLRDLMEVVNNAWGWQ